MGQAPVEIVATSTVCEQIIHGDADRVGKTAAVHAGINHCAA